MSVLALERIVVDPSLQIRDGNHEATIQVVVSIGERWGLSIGEDAA